MSRADPTSREIAQQLEATIETIVVESARKDALIAALKEENELLLALVAQVRADAARKETR